MPIRIYALAKQLKLDSKVLVDICTKSGVTGKGSALASLTDQEVERVTAFINGGKAAQSGGPTKVSEKPKAASAPTVFRREDYIAPAGTTTGRVPVLPSRPSKLSATKKKPGDAPSSASPADREKEKGDRAPAIKLAPMPMASKLPRRPKKSQPAPQKPDIKLPLDAIRAGKAGTKPLSEHLRKHEEKRIAAESTKTSPRKESPQKTSPAKSEPSTAGRERPRRGGRSVAVPGKGKDESVSLGGREQRQLKRKKAATARRRGRGGDEESSPPALRKRTRIRRTGANTAAPRRESVVLTLPCTVRSFSEAIGVSARDILAKLLELGTMSNIAATLDAEMAELLAAELGAQVKFQHHEDLEQKVIQSLEGEDDPETLLPRPPIVTFLGHVDHGKTSLLDRIIGIDVVTGEKGGITQHIRAYRVEKDGRTVAFVDTPGHEAFTEMRARGANVTDIAVLVVAADDGIMPQTEEAISHAKAAEVPIVVALNKIDLPGANTQRTYEQLAANELLPSEWGGETEVIQTSATTGEGIDKLLETLLTVAELHEYKAASDRPACGTCLESELHEGRGVVAKLLVRKGTLHVGDVVVCGTAVGRVKAMYDTLNP
ncbi:MAG: translation initiation factor IF-2 N-terminal domain-containing protein, partial [Pirellulales bacterium]|nr:translation initiation factor IF-2 N-terminal domain-containing protein [Pirellulales bacterium]